MTCELKLPDETMGLMLREAARAGKSVNDYVSESVKMRMADDANFRMNARVAGFVRALDRACVPGDTGSFDCRQGELGVQFLPCLGKSISMLGPGVRSHRRKRLVAPAVAVPPDGRLSIGYIGFRGGNARNADAGGAAVTRTVALGAFKSLPQTGASSRKLASALLECVPRLQIVRHPVVLA